MVATLQAPPAGLEAELERLLGQAGITIAEDPPSAVTSSGARQSAPDCAGATSPTTTDVDTSAAIAAAHRRIAADRVTRRPAKVVLRADEEVGLALLVRGASGEPLPPGGFAGLKGVARAAAVCMVLHNQGLIHTVARRYAPPGMTYDDLVQHGNIGLLRAVELFDPHLGTKFSTYATHWVRQAITRGIANDARMIRIPVHMHERVLKVWRTRDMLTVDGRTPSVNRLALACELSEAQVIECLVLGPQDLLSLDTPVGPGGEATLGDLYDHGDPDADPGRASEAQLLRDQVRSLLNTLDDREAGVLARRHGFIDGRDWTLDEIGQVYGLTRERIRQIEKKAMGQLSEPGRLEQIKRLLAGDDVIEPVKPHLELEGESAPGRSVRTRSKPKTAGTAKHRSQTPQAELSTRYWQALQPREADDELSRLLGFAAGDGAGWWG